MTTWPASNLPDEAQAWRRKVEELLDETQRAGEITRTNVVAASAGQSSLARTLANANLSIEEQNAAIVKAGRVPAPPENPAVTSDAYFDEYGVPRAAVFASCDPVTLDIDGNDISVTKFELHGRPNTSDGAWQMLAETQVVDIPTVAYSPLPAGEEWIFRLHAISDMAVRGNPSAEIILMLAKDTTAPPKPATPTGESRLGQVTISTTGLTFDGAAQPPDFSHFEVLMSTTIDGVATVLGRMEGVGQNTLHIANQPYDVAQWYCLVGVDFAGNKSVESDRISVTAVPVADTDVSDQLLDSITNTVTQNVTTNLGNTITWATIAPVAADGSGKPVGHLWYQRDAGDTIIGTWEWDGTTWQPRQFDDATLASIDAGKINAGYLDAARIDAKTLTAEKLLIGNMDNLISDPSFALPIEKTWYNRTQPDLSAWSYVDTTGLPGRAITLTANATTQTLTSLNRVAVKAGEKYAIGARVQVDTTWAGVAPNLQVLWLTADGSLASTWGQSFPIPLANWTNYGYIVEVPNLPEIAYAQLDFVVLDTATSGTMWLGKPYFRPATTGELLVDGSVTTLKLAANAVEGDKIAGNAIDGMTITGATVRTAASGQRVQLDVGGLKAYNSSGAVTGQLSASSGGLQLSGTLRSGSGNQRAELVSTGLSFYESGGALAGNISGSSPTPGVSANSLVRISAGTGTFGITVGKQEVPGGGTQVDLTATGASFSYLNVNELAITGDATVGGSFVLTENAAGVGRYGGLAADVSGQNLNSIIWTGVYRGNNMTNSPNGTGWWYIEVIAHDSTGWRLQRVTGYTSSGARMTYERQQTNGTWTQWYYKGPFAQAQGRVSVASSGVTTVTFPSGRFSVTPAIVATPNDTSVIGLAHVTGVSSTSFEVRFFQYNAVQAAGTISWIATQGTPGSANG